MIFSLRSGEALSLAGGYISSAKGGQDIRIAKLSNACGEKLQRLKGRGYHPYSAKIRFIVAWRRKDDTEEIPIVLPDLYFRKYRPTANGH